MQGRTRHHEPVIVSKATTIRYRPVRVSRIDDINRNVRKMRGDRERIDFAGGADAKGSRAGAALGNIAFHQEKSGHDGGHIALLSPAKALEAGADRHAIGARGAPLLIVKAKSRQINARRRIEFLAQIAAP